MHGQRIGKVSSFDQNPDRQLDQVQVDRQFIDKASGKDTERPQLDALLSFAREGDTVVVHSINRLACNLDDLRRLVQQLTQRQGGARLWHHLRVRFGRGSANPVQSTPGKGLMLRDEIFREFRPKLLIWKIFQLVVASHNVT